VKLKLPQTNQPTIPITITTYDGDSIIDKNDSAASTQIVVAAQKIPSEGIVSLGSAQSGETSDITISLQPVIVMPVGTKIHVYMPKGFEVDGAVVCREKPVGGIELNSGDCQYVSGRVTFTTAVELPNTGINYLYIKSSGRGVTNPTNPNDYVFHVETYESADGAMIEAFSYEVSITPIPFGSSASIWPLENKADIMTVMYTSFVTIEAIPEGSTATFDGGSHGEILYRFRTTSGVASWFRSDLGTGKGVDEPVPCLVVSGLQPINTATGVQCNLIPGSGVGNDDYATIRVT
jgi:hypothetical protein